MTEKKSEFGEPNYDMNYNLFLLKTSLENLKSAQGNYYIEYLSHLYIYIHLH